MKSERHLTTTTKSQKRPRQSDLLGCVCLDEHNCQRNCQVSEESMTGKPYTELVKIRHRSSTDALLPDDEPSNIVFQIVVQEEHKRPLMQVVGLAAWSNGRMRIWFD